MLKHPENQTLPKFTRELLGIYLARKSRNPAYSVRALARQLGVSQTYLSLVFAGKRGVPSATAARMLEALSLPSSERERLLHSLEDGNARPMEQAKDLDIERFRLMSRWHHFAILDLMTLDGFRSEVEWISKAVGITAAETRDALDRLDRLDLIDRSGASWRKKSPHLTVQIRNPEKAAVIFHLEALSRAQRVLQDQTPEAFKRRKIISSTVAVNPKRIAAARRKIERFQAELCGFLSQGKCTELYSLNVQLFPNAKTKE